MNGIKKGLKVYGLPFALGAVVGVVLVATLDPVRELTATIAQKIDEALSPGGAA